MYVQFDFPVSMGQGTRTFCSTAQGRQRAEGEPGYHRPIEYPRANPILWHAKGWYAGVSACFMVVCELLLLQVQVTAATYYFS